MVQEQVTDRLLLVGTAHVSPESVAEVRAAIDQFRPDVVAVELDQRRLDALENKQQWEATPFHKLFKDGTWRLFLVQVLLSGYQRRLGEQYGAEPGTEMLAGVQAARAQGSEVLLADRDVGITMRRAYSTMGFGEKMRITWEIFKAMFGAEDGKAPTAQNLTQEDTVTAMMNELGQIAPSIKTVVIDERDTYLAARIQAPIADGKRVVAVVGAGHLPGIRKKIQAGAAPPDLAPLETVPAKRFQAGKFIFTWGFLILLFGLFGYFAWQGFASGNWSKLVTLIRDLFIWGGGLAALGCLLARGHPYSILTAFAVAPFTILHPGLAAGWFSGLVEAWVHEPRVADFRALSRLDTMKAFFNNRVVRVLLVAAFTNLGAMIGAGIVVGKSAGDIGAAGGALGDLLTGIVNLVVSGQPWSLVALVGAQAVLAWLWFRGRRNGSQAAPTVPKA